MKVLVTGGGGYIGSFMVKRLLDDGYEVLIIDNLKRGHEEAIDKRAQLEVGDVLDKSFLSQFFEKYASIDGVIHFAGLISMAESVRDPGIYFETNVMGTLNLLEEMKKNNIKRLVFSSTAGVYGNPIKIPIPESHKKEPTNPYGESKLIVERILPWYESSIRFASLRYFNACGAALDGSMGEMHNPETHIIPLAISSVLNTTVFTLYGTDYETPDKTAVRDYIHVLDLVTAHVLALEKLDEVGSCYLNVGTGTGHSNKEVLEMVKKITGVNFAVAEEDRRPGDADVLVADPSSIQKELGFSPQYSSLETIVESSWKWHKNRNSEFRGQNSE